MLGNVTMCFILSSFMYRKGNKNYSNANLHLEIKKKTFKVNLLKYSLKCKEEIHQS